VHLPHQVPAIGRDDSDVMAPHAGVMPSVKQKCWSAKNCTGNVLSNRDKHNCKVKSTGKSWSDKSGNCSSPL
jgi:hypothetical protein